MTPADGAGCRKVYQGRLRLEFRSPYQRMLEKVRVAIASPHAASVGECWLFEGAIDQNGHGNVRVKRRRPDGSVYWSCDKAHRISHTHHFGPIPAGLVVRHACDVANCVRPEHVKDLGTQAANVADMIMRKRAAWQQQGEPETDPDCPF